MIPTGITDPENSQFLNENKSPSRKVNELDNRGSHFYLTMYWAQALAAQATDTELQTQFTPIAEALASHEDAIVAELNAAQGKAQEINGYYHPDQQQVSALMRPSETFNDILAKLNLPQTEITAST